MFPVLLQSQRRKRLDGGMAGVVGAHVGSMLGRPQAVKENEAGEIVRKSS